MTAGGRCGGRLGLLALAALVTAACTGGGGPATVTAPLAPGRFVASSALDCFASADWQVAAGSGGGTWSFRGVADVVCHVATPPQGNLRLHLVPSAGSRGRSFRATWDERELSRVERAAGRWTIEVPAAAAGPGRHVLTVERLAAAADGHDGGDAGAGDAFDRVGWEVEGARAAGGELAAGRWQAGLSIADFLLHGVAGRTRDLAGGVLFAGPGELELDLPPGAVRLLARPENVSFNLARFAAAAGDEEESVQVVPGSRGELVLDLPAGARRVRLAVRGEAGGAFLWGGLRVERRRGAGEPSPPPIVLVSLDTTRRDALGAYGGGPTPHLDELAAGATVYTDAASTSPWTLPAHASMVTGLLPGRHGAGVRHRSLRVEAPTLAEALSAAGYASAGVAGGHLVSHRFGLARGFTFFRDPRGFDSPGSEVTALAESALDRIAGGGPFLLFVHYFDPHFPYAAPYPFRRRAGEPEAARALAGLADWPAAAAGDVDAWRALLDRSEPVPPVARRWLERAYRAEIAHLDAQVGRLFAALDRRGLFDPALVVVTADHGELLGEGDRLSHAFGLEPELVEVPLVVKWPGQRVGRRVTAPASLVDLYPTLLTAAGVVPPPSDGRGLAAGGGMAGGDARTRQFFEEHESRIHPLTFRRLRIAAELYGVASPRQRSVVWPGGASCAQRDGGGWRSRPCREDGAELLDRLRRLTGGGGGSAAAAGEVSDEERAHLRALGYL